MIANNYVTIVFIYHPLNDYGFTFNVKFVELEHCFHIQWTVHWEYSYHRLVPGGGVEDGTALIKTIVGAALYGYHGDKSGACSGGGGGI